ncbi:DUF1365 domain-containing protein [Rhodococcus rhodnii]|uniref:DUF1365 domain-containing protein n=2 Tax=Rhodococcus rhodnii TaxID=38312 RepID=R7WNN2_9NOCA|nr:DUF1365 family protein [Rhodococcus rhodnii]EOM76917.1 hypothetical protein Rrhod_1830 [Rhodococcus rhodnii LMG 5362]TXG89727.1 DUF1365 domain-containing protein [Rhodococcus rhodnii]
MTFGGAALYSTRIRHARTGPVRNVFAYRSLSWLVDVDELPRAPWYLRPVVGFRAADHLEPPAPGEPDTLRSRAESVLRGEGIEIGGGSIRALLNSRTLGYVFDPLSLFWCHDRGGALVAVIAEVHNTYGGRHAYVVRAGSDVGSGSDTAAAHTVRKSFPVSPFNDVSGHYTLRVPEPGERLAVDVVLRRDGQPPFTATMRGTRRAASRRAVIAAAVSTPLAPIVVAARIRIQGIGLWARGLPITRGATTDGNLRVEKETVS